MEGRRVLDVGCGLGPLSIDIASRCAREVVGLDINSAHIAFAQQYALERFPGCADVLSFRCCKIKDLNEEGFDVIISKDVMEHVLDFERVFGEMTKRLRPGGRLYLGFGPLWYSPFGGHGVNTSILPLTRLGLPWAHLLLPESFLVKRVNRDTNSPIKSIREYGLNKLPYETYKSVIMACGLHVLYYRVNVSGNRLARILSPLRRIPCIFRARPPRDSSTSRPVIPIHRGHPFQTRAAAVSKRGHSF